jgi:hypothetical protein
MTRDTNFNIIASIYWFKVFIMPKHVFYDLLYATTISNMTLKMTNSSLAIVSQPYDSCN